MKVNWTPEAEQDRLDIIEYVASENFAAAEKLNLLFDRAVDRIAAFPYAAREGNIPDTRELIPHPSYRLVYETRTDTIWITALFHTSRQWPPVEPEGGH